VGTPSKKVFTDAGKYYRWQTPEAPRKGHCGNRCSPCREGRSPAS
jgi:hypothetical protein